MVGLRYRGKNLQILKLPASDRQGDGSTMLLFELEKAETLLLELQDAVQKARARDIVDPSETAH